MWPWGRWQSQCSNIVNKENLWTYCTYISNHKLFYFCFTQNKRIFSYFYMVQVVFMLVIRYMHITSCKLRIFWRNPLIADFNKIYWKVKMDSLLFKCSAYFELTDCQSCQKTHNFLPEFFPQLNVMRIIRIRNAINWLLF